MTINNGTATAVIINTSISLCYVDNDFQGTRSVSVENCTNTGPLVVGCSRALSSYNLVGQLDDIMVFNRSLSENEVKIIYDYFN